VAGRALVVASLLGILTAACSRPPGAIRLDGGPDADAAAGAGGPGGQGGSGGSGGSIGGSTGGTNTPAWQWTVRCPDGHEPTTPIDYGRCAVDQALAEAGVARAIGIATIADGASVPAAINLAPLVDARAESYAISPIDGTTWVVGRDEVGAMYGALELAERLRLHGGGTVPPATTLRGAPVLPIRAANMFWTLPDPDQPETEWWFHDEGFWRDYLDLLAHARMDVLDIHGTYDLATTIFPNLLVQLARSPTFPDVGVPAAERERNLAMLNRVIAMARARGIRVGLMTYSAGVDGYSATTLSDADLQTYVREAAFDLATRAPELALLGFRIGESGQGATWYIDTVVAGTRAAATGVTVYTRSWISSKPEIVALATAVGPEMVLEAKFNGEQLGPPYPIAGGAMSTWGSYSYQGYLNPPAPWQFVSQVRAAGTHRIFRQASFARTQRVVGSLGFSPRVRGFTLEPPTAYTPQRDFYHASASDRFSPWAFARDDLMYLLWGRLGYDPGTPESTFRAIAAREAGTDGLWPALQAASDIVPWIQTGHTCGPDHRLFAAELELGGNVAEWAVAYDPSIPATGGCENPSTFDTFAIASAAETAAGLVIGAPTSRLSSIDVATEVLTDVERTMAALAAADPDAIRDNPVARDMARESLALADLGRYFAHKLRAATALAVYQRTGRADWLAAARAETAAAHLGWRALAEDTTYILPWHDRLRLKMLGFDPFHWAAEVPALAADDTALDAVAAAVAAAPPVFTGALPDPRLWLASPRIAGPGFRDISVTPAVASATSWTVRARFATAPPINAGVRVLWKPFDSERDWTAVDAAPAGDGSYTASITGDGTGGLFAVEVRHALGAWRYPDPRLATPYVSLPP
jgi:hypothetical protein